MLSRLVAWWRGPLSVEDITLIAHTKLLAEGGVYVYECDEDGNEINRRPAYPVTPRQAFRRLGLAMGEVAVAFEGFGKTVEALGKQFEGLLIPNGKPMMSTHSGQWKGMGDFGGDD